MTMRMKGGAYAPAGVLRDEGTAGLRGNGSRSILSAAEAKAIQELWKTQGLYTVSDTGRNRLLQSYQSWRTRVEGFLARLPAKLVNEAQHWRQWFGAHDAHVRWMLRAKDKVPKPPGLIPPELAAQLYQGVPLGAPPLNPFRRIRIYNVKLPDGSWYSFRDDPVQLADKELIHENGISKIGLRICKRSDTEELLAEACISEPTERKVMLKLLEAANGFEAISTYDTDFISVGIVSFAAGETGDGPLCQFLMCVKSAYPTEFEACFRSLGIDVDLNGLAVVHLDTGELLRGKEAVRAIIEDKRLTALFQNAGQKSRGYQITQLQLAMELYYLAKQEFTLKAWVPTGDKSLSVIFSGRHGDVLRSEAGKVALMERAVRRGVANAQQAMKDACLAVIHEKGVMSLEALAQYEELIVPLLQVSGQGRLRALEDKSLSQPKASPEV